MNKKGISTLIATILIISIGTLLTLAVFSFSDAFVKKVQAVSDESVEKELACMQDVVIDLKNGCYMDKDTVRMHVASNGIRSIKGFIVRFYSEGNQVNVDEEVSGLSQFMEANIESKWNGNADKIKMVEVIPKITISENKVVVCSNAKKSIGNINVEKTLPKCS